MVSLLIGYLIKLVLFGVGLLGMIWSTYEIMFTIVDNTKNHTWQRKDILLIFCLLLYLVCASMLFVVSFYSPIY